MDGLVPADIDSQVFWLMASMSAVLFLVFFIFPARCQQVCGRKAGVEHNWMAYVPFLNSIHFFWIGGLSGWLILTMFLPLINIVVIIYALVRLMRARGVSGWAVLWLLLPTHFLVMAYVTYHDETSKGRYVVYVGALLLSLVPIALSVFMSLATLSQTGNGSPGLPGFLQDFMNQHSQQVDDWVDMANKRKKVMLDDEILTKNESFYTWVDINGSENYASRLEDVPEAYRDQVSEMDSKEIGGDFQLMDQAEEGQLMNQLQEPSIPEQLKIGQHEVFVYSFEGNPDDSDTLDFLDTYNVPYTVRDVVANPEFAVDLKMKLGLDINKKYELYLPVIEINGELVQRIVEETDATGRVRATRINEQKIRKLFGLRETFE